MSVKVEMQTMLFFILLNGSDPKLKGSSGPWPLARADTCNSD